VNVRPPSSKRFAKLKSFRRMCPSRVIARLSGCGGAPGGRGIVRHCEVGGRDGDKQKKERGRTLRLRNAMLRACKYAIADATCGDNNGGN